jgi:antitoxin VapB
MQTAKLFPNGQSQAVRLPKEYRFEGDRVYIQRQGDAVVLLPYQRPWQVLFDSLGAFSADFAVEGTRIPGAYPDAPPGLPQDVHVDALPGRKSQGAA